MVSLQIDSKEQLGALIGAVDARKTFIDDTILDDLNINPLTTEDKVNFVNHLSQIRETLSVQIDELVELTKLQAKLESLLPMVK